MFERIKITPHLVLKNFFGYSEFRVGQLEIINNILLKKDTLAILPTGGGKSICFQIPAIILGQNGKSTIVVSPLISLMKDQVDSLNSKGISACYLNSSLSKNKQLETEGLIKIGKIKIIYVSPEKLKSKKFIEISKNINIGMIVIDEAHCISQWGNDFRPSYKEINNFYEHIPKDVVKVAFTATANKKTQKDICTTLRLDSPFIFFKSFSRKNLIIDVIKFNSEVIKNIVLLRILNKHKGQTGIIYCSTKRATEQIQQFLDKNNIEATYYHSKVSKEDKNMIQNSFINGGIKIIIATNAFGMGIDKSDVRFIIHYQIPGNIENYYQEIGRAGRDGEESYCYCFYSKKDVDIQVGFIKKSGSSKSKTKSTQTKKQINKNNSSRSITSEEENKQTNQNIQKLKSICNLLETNSCRTKVILKYFGEDQMNNCGICDNCSSFDNISTSTNIQKHPLLEKVSFTEIELIKKLLKQKYKYKNPTEFLTDIEICYLSIAKPKDKISCMNIPGLGTGWTNKWWSRVAPTINPKDDRIYNANT